MGSVVRPVGVGADVATPLLDPTEFAGLTPAHLNSLFDLGAPLLVSGESLFAR
jgi:hypothetical protein